MQKLLDANVFIEFKLWAGAHHAAQMVACGPISRQWKDNMRAQVRDAFNTDMTR